MLTKVIAIATLGIWDMALTLAWSVAGWAQEANPLMSYLLNLNEWIFVAVKLGVTAFGCTMFYLIRSYASAHYGATLVVVAYSLVMVTHVTVLFF
jgi:hypothetical protein